MAWKDRVGNPEIVSGTREMWKAEWALGSVPCKGQVSTSAGCTVPGDLRDEPLGGVTEERWFGTQLFFAV